MRRYYKYDWTSWFARKRMALRPGTHYQCSTPMFCQQIRNRASERGIKVSIEITPEGVVMLTVVGKGKRRACSK